MSSNYEFDELYNNIVKGSYDFGTGSWAVVNDNIHMKLNNIGEYHPYIMHSNSSFSKDDVLKLKESCLSSSTRNEDDISDKLYSNVPDIKYDKRIGYYSGLYIGHVVEGNFRENGSSGGFGTWIFKELLENKKIDKIINVVESDDDNLLFKYDVSDDLAGAINGAKTKYYPVEFSKVINEVKTTPGNYAIIGLPSFIMELRLLSEIDPIIKQRIKYTIGLVCGHQKSAKFAEFLAWQCGISHCNAKNNFRKKLNDTPANQYAVELVGETAGKTTTVVKPMKDLIGSDWGQGLFKVRASDFTDDVMNETADVTLGDAWLPEYTIDSKGNNIIVVRDPTINQIIEDGISNKIIKVDKVDVETIFRSQASHYRHTRKELRYRLYKKEHTNKWHPRKREQASNDISTIRRLIQDKREELCVNVPMIYLDAVRKNDINYFVKKIKPMTRSYKNLYRVKRIKAKVRKII